MVRIRLDAREDQPWLREGFRHPNLLAWVWQKRARLVGACLTLGRAWVAAGMPRHQKTIGSFEGWAQVMGGILEVAGVPGFLENLNDTYEAADAEGGVWRGFVAQWWQRFGTAEVGVAELYELALESELPLARGEERAKRTSLGQTLKRMRHRMYTVGPVRVRVCHAGAVQGAQRWKLEIETARGRRSQGSRASREPLAFEGGGGHGRFTANPPRKIKVVVNPANVVNLFHPHTCTRTRAQ
jgi:putative DNA primase/helicase